jgi:hypothetical protein
MLWQEPIININEYVEMLIGMCMEYDVHMLLRYANVCMKSVECMLKYKINLCY